MKLIHLLIFILVCLLGNLKVYPCLSIACYTFLLERTELGMHLKHRGLVVGLHCDEVKSQMSVVNWGLGAATFQLSVVDLVGGGASF